MSQFTVYINPPEYLGQWLRHEFWDAESERVVFPRGSAPRAVLSSLLRKAPLNVVPVRYAGDVIPVEVPSFKGINPATFNYLSPTGQTALISACKRLFQSTLYNELHELFSHDVQITDIIYEFMDRHGIDRSERNWETIRQMYARMRKKSQAQKG